MFQAVAIAQSSHTAPHSSLQDTFYGCLGVWRDGLGCFQSKLNQVLPPRCAEKKMYFKPCWKHGSVHLEAFIWRARLTLLWCKGAGCIQWRCSGSSTDIFYPWVHSCHKHTPTPNWTAHRRRKRTEIPFSPCLCFELWPWEYIKAGLGNLTVAQFRDSQVSRNSWYMWLLTNHL